MEHYKYAFEQLEKTVKKGGEWGKVGNVLRFRWKKFKCLFFNGVSPERGAQSPPPPRNKENWWEIGGGGGW